MSTLVLLASDIGARDALRVSLKSHGFDVIVAPHANDAVDRLREGGVDVVVVDYEVEGGIDPLLAGLAKLPDAPPLVLISGAIDAPAVSARLGAAAFVAKPCIIEELVDVLRRATSSRSAAPATE